jgi:DNA repair ATPase RecN
MKRLLLSLLVLIQATSLIAEVQFDEVNNSFYSSPMTPDIDQNKYHDLWTKLFQIPKAWAASYGVYVEDLLNPTKTESEQLKNLENNTAATDNLKNRFKEYFEILGIEAQIDPHHAKTIIRFYLDIRLMNIMGLTFPK